MWVVVHVLVAVITQHQPQAVLQEQLSRTASPMVAIPLVHRYRVVAPVTIGVRLKELLLLPSILLGLSRALSGHALKWFAWWLHSDFIACLNRSALWLALISISLDSDFRSDGVNSRQ